jgi:hypothetical protein
MSTDAWIGIVIAIPLNLLIGLLVQPIQERLKSLGKSRAEAKRDRLQRRYTSVLHFLTHPQEVTESLIIAARDTVISGFFAVFAVASASWYVFLKDRPHQMKEIIFAGTVAVLCNVCAGFWFGKGFSFIQFYKNMSKVTKFFVKVPEDMRDKRKEMEAILIRYPELRSDDQSHDQREIVKQVAEHLSLKETL